jgi:NADH dehydrogenase (ubiquinone) 1 beta subcomplex subunit 5
MGHGPKIMPMTPSRFQWHKFKDLLHFFSMIGLIPVSALIFYVNVVNGPAQLSEIPGEYEPHHWEYHRVSENI